MGEEQQQRDMAVVEAEVQPVPQEKTYYCLAMLPGLQHDWWISSNLHPTPEQARQDFGSSQGHIAYRIVKITLPLLSYPEEPLETNG